MIMLLSLVKITKEVNYKKNRYSSNLDMRTNLETAIKELNIRIENTKG